MVYKILIRLWLSVIFTVKVVWEMSNENRFRCEDPIISCHNRSSNWRFSQNFPYSVKMRYLKPFIVDRSFAVSEGWLSKNIFTSVTKLSHRVLKRAAGRGFVKRSAMFCAVGTYCIFSNSPLTTSPQNFNRTLMCFVRDLLLSLPIDAIAGLVSPHTIVLRVM